MKINLRKSNAIQRAITDTLKSIELVTTVELTEFSDVVTTIKTAGDVLTKNILRKEVLVDALYEIRNSTANANNTSGISNSLTALAKLQNKIQTATTLAHATVHTPQAEIEARLTKIKTSDTARSMYREDRVETGVYTAETLNEFKQKLLMLKKTKQALQDDLLAMNIKTNITLTPETVATLTEEVIV